jgi:hypothetical protein
MLLPGLFLEFFGVVFWSLLEIAEPLSIIASPLFIIHDSWFLIALFAVGGLLPTLVLLFKVGWRPLTFIVPTDLLLVLLYLHAYILIHTHVRGDTIFGLDLGLFLGLLLSGFFAGVTKCIVLSCGTSLSINKRILLSFGFCVAEVLLVVYLMPTAQVRMF